MAERLIKIGVFYDGNYFLHVSNYYNYIHASQQRLSLAGFHRFICHVVAEHEGVDVKKCCITNAHYFRGRLSAQEALQRGNQLYNDRVFDDVLMSLGVTSHYLPLRTRNGRKEEKGIDVWFALEAYEQALRAQFDILVLITADGEYVPLVRKVNALGARTMLLNWEFTYRDDTGRSIVTRTSQDLLQEVTYPVAAHELIERGLQNGIPYVKDLFLQADPNRPTAGGDDERDYTPDYGHDEVHGYGVVGAGRTGGDTSDLPIDTPVYRGVIMNVNKLRGYGFIKYPPNNLFFFHQEVEGCEFADLQIGDEVTFQLGENDEGQEVAKQVRREPQPSCSTGSKRF